MSSQVNISISESENDSSVCTYCRDEFGDLSVWTCQNCNTRLHKACFRELKKCTTLGCHSEEEATQITVDLPQEQLEPPSPQERFILFTKLLLLVPLCLVFSGLAAFVIGLTLYQLGSSIFSYEPIDSVEGDLGGLIVMSGIVGALCYILCGITWETLKRSFQ